MILRCPEHVVVIDVVTSGTEVNEALVVTVVTAIITVEQFSASQHDCGIFDEQLGVCVRGGNGVVILILSQSGGSVSWHV